MILFWTISAAMMLAAVALLAPTLLRRHRATADATGRFNVAIAREHLAELLKQKDAGELSDEECAQARHDLELALAEDLAGTGGATAAPGVRSGRWAWVAAVILVPLLTVPVYLHIGSPELIDAPPGAPPASATLPPVEDLAEQLRARLEANPDNAEGWYLLGRTYMRLQNYAGAAEAYERVVGLLPDEVGALLSLADALTMRDGRRSGPRAIEVLEKALRLQPDSVTALWLLGKAAADRGDTETALAHWRRAYPLLADEPAMQAELGRLIVQAGGTPPAAASAADRAGAVPTGGQAAGGDATGGAAIRVEVALAPALMDRVRPGDILFVLARAEDGPPMPLAVSRHRVDDLPLTVTLTDAMAMMPAMRLSAFPRVRVGARVSKQGQAATAAGDLFAADQVVDRDDPPSSVQLLIDRVVGE